MSLLPIQDKGPWRDKVQAAVDYWLGPSAAPAMNTDLIRRTRMNQIAADLGLPPAANGESMAAVRAKFNAVIAGTVKPGTRILEILGAKARMQLDPWGRQDLTMESGGTISQITGAVSGVAFTQAVGSFRPASTNGARKVPKGDAISAYLEATNMGWAKADNYSLYGVARNDIPGGGGGSMALYGHGANVNTGPRILRQTTAGQNYIRASVGDGTTTVQTFDVPAAAWDGSVAFWLDVYDGRMDFYVNNVLATSRAVVPSLTPTRARLFSSQGTTPGTFGPFNLALLGFADLATAAERNAIAPLLNSIALNLQAA